ncbi:hypothetical protein AB0E08_38815, partial [Streptomyces sp. NPDC048281]
MGTESMARRPGVAMHVRCPDRLPEETYRQVVLEQLHELSPVVQALPPAAALVDLRGALRYHGATAVHLAEVLRLRTVARGVDVRVGIGPTITVAATASAQVPHPGGVLNIEAADAADWLALLLVEELHGIGPRQADILKRYGVDRVGLLAALPAETVQRLLGKAGRTAADRARGIDPRTVIPRRPPASVSVGHRFPHDVLDGAAARSALRLGPHEAAVAVSELVADRVAYLPGATGVNTSP